MDIGPATDGRGARRPDAARERLAAADPGRPCAGSRDAIRPSWREARETHAAGLRGGAAAPAAAPAGGADPARGAALAGQRGGRTARHQRGLGEQRAAAGAGRPGGRRRRRRATPIDPHGRRPAAPARALRDAFERYDMDSLVALLHEDATLSMPPYDMWLQGRDEIAPGSSARASAAAARGCCRPSPTACPPSGSTGRPSTAAATRHGRCRCWRCRRPHRRHQRLPRRGAAVPAVRPALAARLRDPAAAPRPGRSAPTAPPARPTLVAAAPGRRACGSAAAAAPAPPRLPGRVPQPAHVADHAGGRLRGQPLLQQPLKRGRVGTGDRAVDIDDDRSRRGERCRWGHRLICL